MSSNTHMHMCDIHQYMYDIHQYMYVYRTS